ncbi:DUF2829 domain-containing protein [Pyruvatibacter sp.]
MDFSQALTHLKAGHEVTRKGWNGKGMCLQIQRPEHGSKMTLPYIFMETAHADLVPWLASQTDLLSDDWELYGECDVTEAEEQLPGVPVRTLKVNDLFEFAYREDEDEDGGFTPTKVYRVVAPHANLVKPETIQRNTPFFMNQETGGVFQTHELDRVIIVS